MSQPERFFDAADADRAVLRAAVAAVDHFITHLPNAHSGPDRGLTEAWAALTKALALPEPRRVRDCPHCGHISMSDASLCSTCWARLTPEPAPLAQRQVAGGGADS